MSRKICPHCGSRSGYAQYETQAYCFSCKAIDSNIKSNTAVKTEREYVSRPTDFLSYTFPLDAIKWLLKRGITKELLITYDLQWVIGWDRLFIPSYDPCYGIEIGWQARAISTGQVPKVLGETGCEPFLFFSYSWLMPDPVGVIVEDALSAMRAGETLPAVALLGTSLDSKDKKLKQLLMIQPHRRKWLIWFDDDKAGHKAAEKVSSRLSGFGQVVANLTGKYPEPKLLPGGELRRILEPFTGVKFCGERVT